MSDNTPGPATHFFDWRRAGLTVLFAVVYGVLTYLTYLIAVVQIGCAFFLGAANVNIQEFSRGLRNYIGEIIDYVSYNSETKPFPFSAWPKATAPSKASNDTHTS